MAASSETIKRALTYISLGETIGRCAYPQANRIEVSTRNREIYSYGRHFPLVRFVPKVKGTRGDSLFLVNGDRWPGGGFSATNRHQEETRRAVDSILQRAPRMSSIIIPRTALDGASIDPDSIRPLDVRPDRQELRTNTATIPSSLLAREIPTREQCEMTSRVSDPRGGAILASQTLASNLTLTIARTSHDSGNVETLTATGDLTRVLVYRGEEYFVPEGEEYWRSQMVDYDPPKVALWFNGAHDCVARDNGDGTATLTWESTRHWLGDSLFLADRVITRTRPCPDHKPGERFNGEPSGFCDTCGRHVLRPGTITDTVRRRGRYLSSFDYNEPVPLYFLAELPRRSRATTVAMAFEDLAPRAVHAALARGLTVERQGDVFAIPTTRTGSDIRTHAVRRSFLSTLTHNRVPREGEVGYRAPLTRARRRAYQTFRRREYARIRAASLANVHGPTTPKGWRKEHRAAIAYEHELIECVTDAIARANETTDADTRALEHAQNGLRHVLADRPNRNTGYAANGPRVRGRCYSRALSAWASATANANRRYCPPLELDAVRRTLAIYGTAHTATEVAVMRDGTTYIRGVMRHRPDIVGERRERDHRDRPLGDETTWYLAVRNTVPRQ